MLLYRVAWLIEEWPHLDQAERGHPLFISRSRQGAGRFDNPRHYAALYTCRQPTGAIGEIVGNYERVRSGLFSWAGRPELRRWLVRLEIPDDTVLLDLDETDTLRDLGLRPSDVVRRHRELTRRVALGRYLLRSTTGERGITWWSYHHPDWRPVMLWSANDAAWFRDVAVIDAEPLHLNHPDVLVAAEMLCREIDR